VLNDIWVSADGLTWDNIDRTGAVNIQISKPSPMPWDARCIFGASARLNNSEEKVALWIGGGFSQTDGIATPDVWIWDCVDKTKIWAWRQAKAAEAALAMYDPPKDSFTYLSSGIGFIVNGLTGMVVFGATIDQSSSTTSIYSNEIYQLTSATYGKSDCDIKTIEDLAKKNLASITTFYFKGCMWYFILSNQGDDGIKWSRPYYLVPDVVSYSFKP